MSRIVFFCIPAHGHTNPTLGVVRELIARGHQVWYYSYNMLREKIEATGAAFVPCDDYDAELKLSPRDGARIGRDLAFSTRILVDTTLALDDAVCADMRRIQPDCIVADSMALWGKAVALKLGIPFVSSTTTFAFNRHSARIMKQSARDVCRMILSMPKIGQQIRRLQEKGYPIHSALDIIASDESAHTIVYTSPQFQPCAETFPDKYAFVGPSIRPAESAFEKTRDTLIYLSMGTVNNDLLPLYKRCVAALSETAYQVVMSVGDQVSPEAFGALPENIRVFPHVDQIAVLQKADVFISHCGMNSASESLYFGVPLVMLPLTAEQSGVAARIAQLGAGLRLKKTDIASIRSAVRSVLGNPSFRQSAASIAEGFRRCSGAAGAAEKILQVCQNG